MLLETTKFGLFILVFMEVLQLFFFTPCSCLGGSDNFKHLNEIDLFHCIDPNVSSFYALILVLKYVFFICVKKCERE